MKTRSVVGKRPADRRPRNRTAAKKQPKADRKDRDDLLLTQAIQLAVKDAWIRQERNRALGTPMDQRAAAESRVKVAMRIQRSNIIRYQDKIAKRVDELEAGLRSGLVKGRTPIEHEELWRSVGIVRRQIRDVLRMIKAEEMPWSCSACGAYTDEPGDRCDECGSAMGGDISNAPMAVRTAMDSDTSDPSLGRQYAESRMPGARQVGCNDHNTPRTDQCAAVAWHAASEHRL